jgi:hypothetical protein
MLQFRWQTGHMPTGAKHGEFATEVDALIYVRRYYPRAELAGHDWMPVAVLGSSDQYTDVLNRGLDDMIQPVGRLIRTPSEASGATLPTEEYRPLRERPDD